jgi:hypothetical protein
MDRDGFVEGVFLFAIGLVALSQGNLAGAIIFYLLGLAEAASALGEGESIRLLHKLVKLFEEIVLTRL